MSQGRLKLKQTAVALDVGKTELDFDQNIAFILVTMKLANFSELFPSVLKFIIFQIAYPKLLLLF